MVIDRANRSRLKTLANDAVIATFGINNRESRLAAALETTIEELTYITTTCEHCKYCDLHGDFQDDAPLTVEANDVIDLHKKLTIKLTELKNYHVRLAGEIAGLEAVQVDSSLESDLGDWIDDTEEVVDELEALVLP